MIDCDVVDVLERKVRYFACLDFGRLTEFVRNGHKHCEEFSGRDGGEWQLSIYFYWDSEEGGDIRILADVHNAMREYLLSHLPAVYTYSEIVSR